MSQTPSVPLDARGLPPGYPYRPEWEITPRELHDRRRGGGDVVLIDCRTPGEWERVRIDGAQLIPLQEVAQHADRLEEYRDRPVVVHCHHGGRSLRMAMLLRQQGFANVLSLAGGIDLWAIDIAPGMARY